MTNFPKKAITSTGMVGLIKEDVDKYKHELYFYAETILKKEIVYDTTNIQSGNFQAKWIFQLKTDFERL